ncbi:MAG: chemotaxis protein CheC [Dehalococcoidia bacterium]
MDRLQELATAGVENVSRGLTEMFSTSVTVTAMHVRVAPLHEAPNMFGDPELEVVAVYLEAQGDITGHMLLMMQVETSFELCDILLEQPPGTTGELGEMEISALGEVGNIVGSFFLNSLADRGGLRLHITPPGVLCDMAGAALNLAITEVAMVADEAVVIDAHFDHRGRRLPAWFLVFPDPVHLRTALNQGQAQ